MSWGTFHGLWLSGVGDGVGPALSRGQKAGQTQPVTWSTGSGPGLSPALVHSPRGATAPAPSRVTSLNGMDVTFFLFGCQGPLVTALQPALCRKGPNLA